MDVYRLSHLVGWVLNALATRDYTLLWTASVLWEVTELCAIPFIPRLAECWWDSVLLDLLVCNGGGIFIGMKLCQWFELKEYAWWVAPAVTATATASQLPTATPQSSAPEVTLLMRQLQYLSPITVTIIVFQLTIFILFETLELFPPPVMTLAAIGPLLNFAAGVSMGSEFHDCFLWGRERLSSLTRCWVTLATLAAKLMLSWKLSRHWQLSDLTAALAAWLLLMLAACTGTFYLSARWAGSISKPSTPPLGREHQ